METLYFTALSIMYVVVLAVVIYVIKNVFK